MNVDEMRAIFDVDQRRDAVFSNLRREVTPEVVRMVEPQRSTVVVLYSDLNGTNAGAIIRRELDYAATLGYTLNWKLYSHDRPADLGARLAAQGLEPDELEAVMVLDLQQEAPAVLFEPVPRPGAGYSIVRITGPDRIEDVIAVETEVWGEDHGWLHSLAEELQTAPEELSMYCAYVDGVPAAAAWVRFTVGSQFASLWGGSTRAAYRQRGLYTALLAVRAQEARARHLRYLTIDAGPMSRPIVAGYGFQLIAYAQDHKQPERDR
jgi:hypothetical protein